MEEEPEENKLKLTTIDRSEVRRCLDEIYDEAIEVVETARVEKVVEATAIVPGLSLLNVNASLDQIPEEKEPLSCLISPTNDSEEKKRECISHWKLPNVSLNLCDKNLISPAALEEPMTSDSARLLRSLPKARSIQEIIKDHNVKSK